MTLRFYKPYQLYPYSDESLGLYEWDQIIENGTYTKGEFVKQFTDAIQKRTGYEYAIATGSGTASLFLLARYYFKKGFRKIRVPAFTWPSTYLPFSWLGFKVRFVDIDRETWLADFGDMPRENDELFLPVDTFGSMHPFGETALPVEPIDAAQSFGAAWPKNFYPTRIISLSGSRVS